MRTPRLPLLAALLPLLVALAACAPEPRPLHVGHDACAYCKMTLSDERYGAELVTKKGKVYPFDAIECLAAHQLEGRVAAEDVHTLWVVDFENPPHLIQTDEAFFLHSRDLRSPMGMNLTAFGPGIRREAVLHAFYGEVLDWPQVLDLVQASGPAADSTRPAGHPTPR